MSLAERVFGRDDTRSIQASTEDAVNVLKNARRRHVIELIAEEAGPIRVGDLAEQVAARECETSRAEVSSQQRKRAYVGLYQHHIDILADAGALAPWTNTQPVRPGPDIDAYDALREIVEEKTGSELGAAKGSTGGIVGSATRKPAIISGFCRQSITKVSRLLPPGSKMPTGGDEA